MKPIFISQVEEAFTLKQHGILSFNVTDRYLWAEKNIGPSNLSFFLANYFSENGYRVGEYAPATGAIELKPNNAKSSSNNSFRKLSGQHDPVTILNELISLMRRKDESWIFIIHYGEHLAPNESIGASASTAPGQIHALELLHKLSFDDSIANGKSRILIICYSELPAELISRANGYRNIRIDLPNSEERQSFIKFIVDISNNKPEIFGKIDNDITEKEFSSLTAGMPLINIEKLFLYAAYNKTPINREIIRKSKAESITQLAQDLLEVSEPQIGFSDVAGMKPVVEYFKRIINQIKKIGSGVTQKILLQGLPGGGKTHLSQAVAHELGWPLIQFRSIRGRYVGQSEQQLEMVIKIIEQLKPAVILFDEIDQLIGQRGTGASGDSGTSERMIARIFNWLGGTDNQGKILFIGTSNRPDILDPALLDRFRVSFPILNSSKTDLIELIPISLRKIDRKLDPKVSLNKLADILAPLKPSGRSLNEILIHAGIIADHMTDKEGSIVKSTHLLKAAKDYIPIEDPLEMEFIRLTSLSMCSANSFLPWMTIDGLMKNAEIPKDLIADEIVDSKSGFIDKLKLHQKLREITYARQTAKAIK